MVEKSRQESGLNTQILTEQQHSILMKSWNRAIVLPPPGVLMEKLRTAGILGSTPLRDEFYRGFIQSITDRSVTAISITMAWNSYLQILEPFPASYRAVDARLEEIAKLIIPDSEVASSVIGLKREMGAKLPEAYIPLILR